VLRPKITGRYVESIFSFCKWRGGSSSSSMVQAEGGRSLPHKDLLYQDESQSLQPHLGDGKTNCSCTNRELVVSPSGTTITKSHMSRDAPLKLSFD